MKYIIIDSWGNRWYQFFEVVKRNAFNSHYDLNSIIFSTINNLLGLSNRNLAHFT
jgi:hypothetical protein